MDNPDTNPRVQEALSARHYRVAIVATLEDGSFAVFSGDRTPESLILVSDPDDLALACASRAAMFDRVTPSRLPDGSPDNKKRRVSADFSNLFNDSRS